MQADLEQRLIHVINQCPAAERQGVLDLCNALYSDRRFHGLSPERVADEVENLVSAGPIKDIPKALDSLHQFIAAEKKLASSQTVVRDLYKAPSRFTQTVERFKALDSVNQIMVGMSLVGAVMGMVNAFDYARHSVSHNEQGETKIQPSMIGLSIMHGGLAIGSALIGMAIMKNAHLRG